MIATEYRLERFIPETANQATFEAVHRFLSRIREEIRPDDPPRSLQATVDNMRGWRLVEDNDVHAWALWKDAEIVAYLFAVIAHREDNRHLMNVNVDVLPEVRRQGLARWLLAKALELAQTHDRTLLIGVTTDRVSAGQKLAERLGARKGMETHTNQLELADLEPELVRKWIEAAKTTASDYALEHWVGPYPEEEIRAVAELLNAMNTAPRDDLEVEDFVITPELLRQWEAYQGAQGLERWALFARHLPTGALAGATIVFFDPQNPETLLQDDTVVVPDHRGHGLGKWLKAAMLDKVLLERPQIKRVRTGNADSNRPMLKINHRLGFKPYLAETVWQLDREKLAAYLR